MKSTLSIYLYLIAILGYSQESTESRKERMIRTRNEQIEAQDHLEPEQGDLTAYDFSLEYHSNVRSYLLKSLSDRPIVRMVVLPSFTPEYVISLDQIGDDYYQVTKIEMDSNIWYSRNPEEIKRSVKTKMINSEIADSLSSLYLIALSKTKYPAEPMIYTDGINYHFAAVANFGVHTATKHSPRQGTRIAQLVEITLKLMTEFDEDEFFSEIEALKDRLLPPI